MSNLWLSRTKRRFDWRDFVAEAAGAIFFVVGMTLLILFARWVAEAVPFTEALRQLSGR